MDALHKKTSRVKRKLADHEWIDIEKLAQIPKIQLIRKFLKGAESGWCSGKHLCLIKTCI